MTDTMDRNFAAVDLLQTLLDDDDLEQQPVVLARNSEVDLAKVEDIRRVELQWHNATDLIKQLVSQGYVFLTVCVIRADCMANQADHRLVAVLVKQRAA